MPLSWNEDYLRSALFGLQDGIVSTTGVVIGISAGVEDRAIIMLAGFVAVAVEASSMAAGQYSSEKAVHQLDKTGKHTDSLVFGAVIMFCSYLIAGMIPIIPMILPQMPIEQARILSIFAAFLSLFLIGLIKGKIVKDHPLRSAFEMLFIGGMATIIGLLVGLTFKV